VKRTAGARTKPWIFFNVSCLLMCLSPALLADSSSWGRTPDQRGARSLESGDAQTASEVFKDSGWRGISHYRSGNFAEAQREFSNASDNESRYNEGTAAARAGDYQTAVEKLQQAADANPNHEDALHNLEIVKQLLDNQQQSSDQNQDSDQDQQNDAQEGNDTAAEKSGQDGETGDQQSQQNGEQGQQGDDSQSSQGEQDSSESQQSDGDGELSASAEAANQSATEEEAPEDDSEPGARQEGQQQTDPSDQTEKQGGTAEQSGGAQNAEANPTDAQTQPMSESEQATEQWMRRIPDDPSQLLRNKIKLNHMIQHENVTDLPEPW